MGKPKTKKTKAPRDLKASDASTTKVKGGASAVGEVLKNFGNALNTAARGG